MWRTVLLLAAFFLAATAAQAKWKTPIVPTADRPPPPAPEVPPADPALPIPLYHDRPEGGESIHSWWHGQLPPGFDALFGDMFGPLGSGSRQPVRRRPFFTALHTLAQRHGWDLPSPCAEGYALLLEADGRHYVVAVLRDWDGTLPGDAIQHLLLLDREGRLLDRLSCSFRARLTGAGQDPDEFHTTVHQPAAADGAQVVIRYVPEDGNLISGDGSHELTHQSSASRFRWDQGVPENVRSTEWYHRGLCRVAIRDGKFAVLFPKLEQPGGRR
jgi:hypothetical protein